MVDRAEPKCSTATSDDGWPRVWLVPVAFEAHDFRDHLKHDPQQQESKESMDCLVL
eukprot:CAMPEP_0194750266 /NCGR_PEP_ID=MMETSP0323_2-20130528/4320_1 /TAXON_ID=2866 ORGANISM="Crypthecodinium cohnii, Strain Seligo" /NCGR_SAMPLE_ID=MMETSP0323_2 /ASSEMBLY_ACC=CAM_ASM_000346 /LENGTH=55 /DNA_ID=CAMNT_0039665839 /DNA_START=366 /DNA_END=530 /DNA_ORIENTATION=-